MDVELPGTEPRSIAWDQIHGLRSRPINEAELLGPDDVVLARIPESLIMGGGSFWRSESIASIVVRRQPQRYRLSGANWVGEPNEFSLRDDTSVANDDDPWATRRRLANVATGVLAVAVAAFLAWQFLPR